MTRTAVVAYTRLALALACVVSLVARYQWGVGSATFRAGNFFGYLTIQSNIAFVISSVLAGVLAWRLARDPAWLNTVRAAVLACTVSSGAIYVVIVQQSAAVGLAITVPWSDVLLHFVIPPLAIAEWILSPGRGRARWITPLLAVGFTVGWGIVTLIRGAIVGWYPYFFLDPNQVSIGQLALLCGIALAFFAGVASGVVGLSRLRRKRR